MEKKAFKFNVIDILAVLLIVAVLAFVGWKLLGNAGVEGMAPETVGITYTVRCENVAAEMYENCARYVPANLMASGSLLDAKITAVEAEPVMVPGEDGKWLEDPDHVTLLFTVEARVLRQEVMNTKVGSQEVRIGRTDYILKTEEIEFQECTIVDVIWKD